MIDLINQFNIQGTFAASKPFGNGHINDTYLITTRETTAPDYILQRVNKNIFKDIPAMMNNKVLVTEHLKKTDMCLTVIFTKTNHAYFCDAENNYWVCYRFIENSRSHDVVQNIKQAFEGGKTVGRFLARMNDFPSGLLHETLPNFHHIGLRYESFLQAVQTDRCDRVKACKTEIEFVQSHIDAMHTILKLGAENKIPLRVTHNDTKFNNILFDENDNGLCVIDLDTVMPGYIHYDFSDALRTVGNAAAEDETDLSKIDFNVEFFTEFSRGFLNEIKRYLTPTEKSTLAMSVPLLPFIIGMRFLTDYLMGDVYYKTHSLQHNLQRARAQLQLVRCIEAKMPVLEAVIQQLLGEKSG